MIYIYLIAVSLALDAFAVAVTNGLAVHKLKYRSILLMALYFGGFQFIMPLLGWLFGSTVSGYVTRVSPYISFLLLGFIGGKMVWDSVFEAETALGAGPASSPLTHRRLTVLAIATSIDAFAVGVTLAFLPVSILSASAVIGIVAFVLSFLGGMIGKRLGEKFQKRAELIGGVVLICIGLKILLESFF